MQFTHCLLQRHKWHPCMPQQCACCACIEKCKWRSAKRGEVGGSCVLSLSVNMVPCADELITRRKSSPTMNSLKRAKIECQIFHTVRTTVVEIYTRGHFRWFAGHCCLLIRSNYSSGPLIYGNVHRWGHRLWKLFWFKSHFYDTAFTCARKGCGNLCCVRGEQSDSCDAKKLAATLALQFSVATLCELKQNKNNSLLQQRNEQVDGQAALKY